MSGDGGTKSVNDKQSTTGYYNNICKKVFIPTPLLKIDIQEYFEKSKFQKADERWEDGYLIVTVALK